MTRLEDKNMGWRMANTILKTVAVTLMTASLVFEATATAVHAAGTGYVTRGQYVEQLLQAVGIAPISNAQQTFTDVPKTNPYFGYVEAAVQAGITTGMTKTFFGVNDSLTRAEAAAFDLRAYSGEAAHYAQKTAYWNADTPPANPNTGTFSDATQIPTALQGDVAVATWTGLLRGFPNGTFGPMQDLTQAQTADLVQQLKSVLAVSQSSPIDWRFLDANAGPYKGIPAGSISMQQAQTSAVHIGDIMAAMVLDLPFSSISQYVEPSHMASVQQQFDQMEQQFQSQDVPSGIRWKVLGVSNGLTEIDYYPSLEASADYLVEPMLTIQSVSATTGQPVTLPTLPKSPRFGGPVPNSSVLGLNVPVGLDQDGLIAHIDSNYYSLIDSAVTPAQATDQAEAVFYGSNTSFGDQDLGSAIAVSGN